MFNTTVKFGTTFKAEQIHKLTERNFINQIQAVMLHVLPEDNNCLEIEITRTSKKIEKMFKRKEGFHISAYERALDSTKCINPNKNKIYHIDVSQFTDEIFAAVCLRLMKALNADLTQVAKFKPTEEEICFEVLRNGVDQHKYAAAVAFKRFKESI